MERQGDGQRGSFAMTNYRGSVDRCNPGGGGCCWGKKSTRAKQAEN